jgi:hypothetical protein
VIESIGWFCSFFSVADMFSCSIAKILAGSVLVDCGGGYYMGAMFPTVALSQGYVSDSGYETRVWF